MQTLCFRALPQVLCAFAALCLAPAAWSQVPVLPPSQVIDAPANPGTVDSYNWIGPGVELQDDRLLLTSSFHIVRAFERDSEGIWEQSSLLITPAGPYKIQRVALSGTSAVLLTYDSSNPEQIIGRLYVFHENQPQWDLVQAIDLPSTGYQEWISASLAFDGQTIAVGAYFNSAVYLYTQNSTGTFDLTTTIQDLSFSGLGASVAIHGDELLAGAPWKQPGGGVNVYQRVANTWLQTQTLVASETETSDRFGTVLSMDGTRVAITAEGADMSPSQYWDHGAVYIFQNQNGLWTEEQKLVKPPRGSFGSSLDLKGERLAVSAPNIVTDDGIYWYGRAYAYQRIQGTWSLLAELEKPAQQSNGFASDLAIEGTKVMTSDPDISTPDPIFDGQAYEYDLQGATP